MTAVSSAKLPDPATPPPPVAHPTKLVEISRIRESPFQPRLLYPEKEQHELEASIREKGVLQPVKLRPIAKAKDGQDLEIVFGHRRLRGSVTVGLDLIPAMIVDMTDEQVASEQLVENHQRKDIHELEEADQFTRLHKTFKWSVADIAKKIGLSAEYVYARMKLTALGDAGRKAFLAGKLHVSTALMIARISDPKRQAEAVKDVTAQSDDGPLGARQVSAHLQRHYMLRLVDAPFDTKDAKLLPAAGACGNCPKNSAAERALFGDVDPKAGDLCTDSTCYGKKSDAAFGQRAAQARTAGGKVLDDSKSARLFYDDGRLQYNVPFVDLDAPAHFDPAGRTYRKVLGKGLEDVKVTLARDPNKKLHELLAREDVDKLAKQAGIATKPKHSRSAAEIDSEAKRRLDTACARANNEAVIDAVIAKATKGALDERYFRTVLAALVRSGAWADGLTDALKRRGLHEKGKRPPQILEALVPKMTLAELAGWVLEVSVLRWGSKTSFTDPLHEAAKVYGVDAKAVGGAAAKAVRSAVKDKRKPTAKPKAQPAGKAKAKATKKPARAKAAKAKAAK